MKKILSIYILSLFLISCGFQDPVSLKTGRITSVEYLNGNFFSESKTILIFDDGSRIVVPKIINVPDTINVYTLFLKRCNKNHDFDEYYFVNSK